MRIGLELAATGLIDLGALVIHRDTLNEDPIAPTETSRGSRPVHQGGGPAVGSPFFTRPESRWDAGEHRLRAPFCFEPPGRRRGQR